MCAVIWLKMQPVFSSALAYKHKCDFNLILIFKLLFDYNIIMKNIKIKWPVAQAAATWD